MKLTGRSLELLLFFAKRPTSELSGYELTKSIPISSGTLYPLLVKLHQGGVLEQRWEEGDPHKLGRPRRRYYKISGAGIRAVDARMRVIDPDYRVGPILSRLFSDVASFGLGGRNV